jgi:hypothetical protein
MTMSWILTEKPKILKVTHALAQKFASMDPAPHDRPMSERRLMIYRKIVAENGFRMVSWATAFCVETAGTYRVNGKHTSTMLAAMDPLPEFYVSLEEYRCDTLEDVAKLYATFDSSVQSRTAHDIYLSFAAAIPELSRLPGKHISTAVGGMSLHLGGGEYSRNCTAAERAENLLEYPEFVLWVSQIMSEGREGGPGASRRDVKHIQRAACVGAMMGCWLKAKGPAEEFWKAVRDETGKTPTTPDRKLARYLSTTGMTDHRGAKLKQATAREMYVKCIHAWNAWRRQESTNLNYHPEKDVPSFR